MKLLLCSDFKNFGTQHISKFFETTHEKTCLFVPYACENDEEMYENHAQEKFDELGIKTVNLTEDYDFSDKIDMIYVRGGNATKLIHLLKKNNQFNKIKNLVEKQDVLYMGNSAGALLAGSDTEWTLESEPYEFDLKQLYGKDALKGFGWVNKMVFVHCSKYRMLWSHEIIDGSKNWRVPNTEYYGDYLRDRKKYDKNSYITLGNNQILYQNGDITTRKVLTTNWSNIPVSHKQPEINE